MTETSEEPAYEFDVAISYAGEDRELVEEIVRRIKDAGIRVFYDTDYQPAMWGEDLIEYLDQVYRVKARYAIMFISRFYEKKCGRVMSAAVLWRARWNKEVHTFSQFASIARLLKHRTLGYLDARLIGPDGV